MNKKQQGWDSSMVEHSAPTLKVMSLIPPNMRILFSGIYFLFIRPTSPFGLLVACLLPP